MIDVPVIRINSTTYFSQTSPGRCTATDYPVHEDNCMCCTSCWVLYHEVWGLGHGSPKLCQSVALQVHFLNFIHKQLNCLCFPSIILCMRCTACYAFPNHLHNLREIEDRAATATRLAEHQPQTLLVVLKREPC